MENSQIIQWNIKESKENIKKSIQIDYLIIFFTRVIEDLRRYRNPNFYSRIKDIFFLIYPYSELYNTKQIFIEMKNSDFNSEFGIQMNKQEKEFLKFFLSNLDSNCKLKENITPKIESILDKLIEKYLPNSSKIIEHYIIGKLISSVGGIKNLFRKPASTIQLIGAEKALFMHISKKKPSPKYGLIFYSDKIQKSKNKGKTARQLANKLSLNVKIDYFRNFFQ